MATRIAFADLTNIPNGNAIDKFEISITKWYIFYYSLHNQGRNLNIINMKFKTAVEH